MLFSGQFAFSQHEEHNMSLVSPKQQAVTYTCPMHPEVKQSTPGKCPKCEMALVKKTVKSTAPIKKPVTKPTPTKKPTAKTSGNTEKQAPAVAYTCPMHPEIHAAEPGNCPKCGMKLIPGKANLKPADKKKYEMQMPSKEGSEKMEHEEGMDMGGTAGTMANIKKAKANLGPVKTIKSDVPRVLCVMICM